MTIAGLDRICFRGFSDEALGRLRNRWGRLCIHERTPGINDVNDCVITPGVLRDKKVFGVYDAENRLVISSALPRGRGYHGSHAETEDVQAAVSDKRSAYYLGWGANHFGHFLLETFSRAWAWEECGGGRVPILQKSVPEFARSLYGLVSRDLAKGIEISKAPTRFSSVLVPEPGFVPRREAYTEYKNFCARIGARVAGANRLSTQPIYLSRTGLDPDTRRALIGEGQLEQLLLREGFRVVRPETLPIAEQINVYNEHEWIVAPMGSACHTRLFADRPTNLVMLCTGDFMDNFLLCDRLSEGTAHYANVLTRARTGYAEDVVLDQEALLRCLKDIGLVRPRISFDSASAVRSEACAEGRLRSTRTWRQWLSGFRLR